MLELRPMRNIIFGCKCCGKVFISFKSCKSRQPKYCCKACYGKSLCKQKKIIQAKKNRRGIKLSQEWRAALSRGRRESEKCKGKNLYNWKGGKDTLRERMRQHSYKRKSKQSICLDEKYLNNILVAQKNKCFYCESELYNYKAIEHLTPLSRGGDNQNYNIVYSCKSCNSKKRQNTLEEFAIKTGRFYLIDKFDFIYASSIN